MAHPKIKVGVGVGTQPPLSQTMAFVTGARALRLDSVWTVDHFQGWFPRHIWTPDFTWLAGERSPHAFYDYQVLMGYLAKRVGNAQLAVGVTEPLRRHPLVIAQSFLTLSHLTKRPPILGIGSGEAENVVPYGIPFERPVARLEEALQIIRLAFTSIGPFEFKGEFYDIPGAVMDIEPGKAGMPELWVAAHGPRMLRLTGEYGDGWYPSIPMTPEEYDDRVGTIRAAAMRVNRDPDAIVPGFGGFVVIGDSEEEARSYLEHPAVKFLALLVPDYAWRARGAEHPLSDGHEGLVEFIPQNISKKEVMAAIDKVDTDAMAEVVIWGDQDQVVRKIRDLGAAGLRHIAVFPASGLVSRKAALSTIKSLGGIAKRLRSGED